VVDHHVDRPGVEALQSVELTGTNRSEIFNYAYASYGGTWKFFSVQLSVTAIGSSSGSSSRLQDQISGVHSGGVPPVPIPNTAVKPASANDSRTAGSLESRSAPD
jgi:hypothetical protein